MNAPTPRQPSTREKKTIRPTKTQSFVWSSLLNAKNGWVDIWVEENVCE
jgi:hypothetical protein